jgi:Rieske Fe-S protein
VLPRRKFTKYLTLGGLALLAAAIWALVRARFGKQEASELVIAHAGEIGIGESKIFQYPRPVDPCILVRTGADSYVAYSRFCTHQECVVFYRPAQNGFACPCHGGFFSLADGSVLEGPPPRPLPRIILERRGDSIVATGVSKS